MKICYRNNKIFDALLICLLFTISFSYFQYGYRYFDLGTYHYDEGIVAYGAMRILNGDIPYLDFWTLYAPGEFYLLAIIFKIFGISLNVTCLFAITILALTVCSMYFIIKKLSSRIFAFLAFLLSMAWLKSYMVYNRPAQPAILLFILSCFPLSHFLKSNSNKWFIIVGAILGTAGLFRQDFGLYFFISVSLVILLKQLNIEKEWKEKACLILKNESCFLFGLLIVSLPLFIYLFVNSAFKDFIKDAIIFSITTYPKVRNLPFPDFKIDTLIFYLPLFIFFLACIRLLFYNWRVKIDDIFPWLILFFLFSGLGLFNYTRVRVDMTHLLPTMIPVIILFVLLSTDFFKNLFSKKIPLYRGFIFAFSAMVSMFFILYLTKPSFVKFSKKPSSISEIRINKSLLNINRARGFYADAKLAQPLVLAIQYIQDNTGKDEKIFVGNLRHDKVVNSDVMFYFFSERHSATKYYELHPGLTNTQKIQKEIISDLIKANVRYIVLWSGSKLKVDEPNESGKSSGVIDLDNFIQENYKIEKTFGSYVILRHI